MSNPSHSDIESLLRSLAPASLAANRDEFFFRAGYAAGAKTKTSRLFWPSAVAALLVVCVGMGVAMQRQNVALQAAIALQNLAPRGEGKGRATEALVDNQNRYTAEQLKLSSQSTLLKVTKGLPDDPQQTWQQLANASFRQHGHLSARGWIESSGIREPLESTDVPTAPRSRPSTYLELRQLDFEG
jgi:hypothetical protein